MSRNLLDSVPHVLHATGVFARYRSLTGTVGGFREDRCENVPRWRESAPITHVEHDYGVFQVSI